MARKTTARERQGGAARPVSTAAPTVEPGRAAGGVQAWHLLVLGVLMAGATGAVVTRGSGAINTVAIVVTLLTAGLVAAALGRTLGPLVSDETAERTEMLAGRTRAAMEREKMLVLRSIKEAEFDRAMRKISEADFHEMVTRLRTRAVGLIRQLEGGGGYRGMIERDLAALLMSAPGPAATIDTAPEPSSAGALLESTPQIPGRCAGCGAPHDADARFCKSCGSRIAEGV